MEIDSHFINTPFCYIKSTYGVPAEMYMEVIVDGKKGVITKDMGNYIGVNFYDNITYKPLACHPTWEVKYLETFNNNPPIEKISASRRKYMEYLSADSGLTFPEWLGIKSKKSK